MVGREAATEISRRRRIGNRVGPEGVQEHLVVAPPLDVLQTSSLAQRVQRQIEHMVGFIIRTAALQNRQARVNRLDQPTLASHSQHQRHAAVHEGLSLVRQLRLQPRRAEHRRCPGHPADKASLARDLQPLLHAMLATSQLLRDPAGILFHWKSLRDGCAIIRRPSSNTTNHRAISFLFTRSV